MAVAKVDPGQAQIFLADIALATKNLTDFQVRTFLDVLQYEWEFGHPPTAVAWPRLAGARNQHQKKELAELVELYDSLSLVSKIRDQRQSKVESKCNRKTAPLTESELELQREQPTGVTAKNELELQQEQQVGAVHSTTTTAPLANSNEINEADASLSSSSSSPSSSLTSYTPLPPEMRAVGIPANAEDEARSEIARAITVALGWGVAPSQTLADRATSAAANLLKLAQDYGEAYAPNRELIAGFDAYTKTQRWTRKWTEAALVAHWKAYVDSTAKKAASIAPPRTPCPDCVDPTQPGWHWKNADGTGGLFEVNCAELGGKDG